MSYKFRPRTEEIASLHMKSRWTGMAVVVESIVLLVFLIVSLTVILQLFGAATAQTREGERLALAVSAATSTAERFASDPTAADGISTQGELTVSCQVSDEQTAAGTLYHATITVYDPNFEKPVYELVTARYVSEVTS